MPNITEQWFKVTNIEHFLLPGKPFPTEATKITLTPTGHKDTTGLPEKWFDIGLVSEAPIILITAYPTISKSFELRREYRFSDLGKIIQDEEQAQLERIGFSAGGVVHNYNLTITSKDADSLKADFEIMKAMGNKVKE